MVMRGFWLWRGGSGTSATSGSGDHLHQSLIRTTKHHQQHIARLIVHHKCWRLKCHSLLAEPFRPTTWTPGCFMELCEPSCSNVTRISVELAEESAFLWSLTYLRCRNAAEAQSMMNLVRNTLRIALLVPSQHSASLQLGKKPTLVSPPGYRPQHLMRWALLICNTDSTMQIIVRGSMGSSAMLSLGSACGKQRLGLKRRSVGSTCASCSSRAPAGRSMQLTRCRLI